jgi:hypothetical protein
MYEFKQDKSLTAKVKCCELLEPSKRLAPFKAEVVVCVWIGLDWVGLV